MIPRALLPCVILLWACNHPTPRSQQQDALKRWTPAGIAAPTAPRAGAAQRQRSAGRRRGVGAGCVVDRNRSRRRGRRACDKAVAAWPESTLGHYLLGVMAEMERRPAEVEQHLARVVELDPAVDDAYVRLAGALRTLGKTADLERLRIRFQAQFNKPLR